MLRGEKRIMEFTSWSLMVALPFVIMFYYLLPHKLRYVWLLLVSYLLSYLFMPKALICLIIVTIISYIMGRLVEKTPGKKLWLFIGISFILLVMFWSKIFSQILSAIGISFYALQAISYLVDIYKEKNGAEKNLLRYALYLAFFPKFISGPIERAEDFLPQIKSDSSIPDYQTCRHASQRILWGYFEKLVIADSAAMIVNVIFEQYSGQSGLILIAGAILYGIQLYVDFDGYSHISVGIAEFLGYKITNNFCRPYLARSIAEFWHRWHISLSTWLKDYIYIPLGGNRKGKFMQCINFLVTFSVSGIWHGMGAKYLIWGLMHGCYQIMGKLLKPMKEKAKLALHIKKNSIILGICQRIMVFVLVDFAWIFFRASSLREAIRYLKHMVQNLTANVNVNTNLFGLEIQPVIFITLFLGILLLFIVEILREMKINITLIMDRYAILLRWMVYAGMILLIVTAVIQRYGMDASGFLYADF